MCSTVSLLNRFKTEIIPKVLKISNKENYKIKCMESSINDTFSLSSVHFIDITLVNNDKINLVIKIPPNSSDRLEQFDLKQLFRNEIIFYENFSNHVAVPKFFYGLAAEDVSKNVIVLENVTKSGFKMCPAEYHMPFRYVINAVRELGNFHAAHYVFKERNPDKFKKIVCDIKESWFVEGNWLADKIKIVGNRPVEWLRKINYDSNFCNKMEYYLGDAFNMIILDAIKPVEPLAVLCHGDFTRTNMLFRELSCADDGDDSGVDNSDVEEKKRLEVMLIDFGMIRYASPSIDLSTLLYLNCTSEDRKNRFDEIFLAYHDALLDYLTKAELIDLSRYSFEKMLEDYKRRAAYGFIVALYFLPFLYGFGDDPDKNNDTTASSSTTATDTSTKDNKDLTTITWAGGDAMSAVFADMLLELKDTGCLNHIIL
ncbi:EcKinase 8 [Microplitis demolitor]|uniref:uncharacterized LOC103575027 n=1 Tax=Microplitis demolitor TaxID=69319 RepID=UPI0004CCE11B|nr:uncharacterized LOC103575027 [Microplitis demolitor]KAG6558342.1 EcKinase 8 [Microplitis demolitor]